MQCQTRSPHGRSQLGQAALEAAIVLPVLLLAGLAALELARWLFLRQALSLALLEAGRTATVTQLHPDTLAAAFEQALLPLYTGRDPRQARDADMARRQADFHKPPWRIEILSPSDLAFQLHADPTLKLSGAAAGLPAINHHYQAERYLAAGPAHATNPPHAFDINTPRQLPDLYEANTLIMRLTYPQRPLLPPLGWLLRLLGDNNGSYSQHVLARGYLPLVRQLALVMHSHPVQWPLPADGRIVRAAGGSTTANTGSIAGLFQSGRPQPGMSVGNPIFPYSEPLQPIPGPFRSEPLKPDPSPSALPPDAATPHGSPSPETDENLLCGIALCCT